MWRKLSCNSTREELCKSRRNSEARWARYGVSEIGFTLPVEIITLQIHKCVWNNSFSRHWTSDSEGQWSVRTGKQDVSWLEGASGPQCRKWGAHAKPSGPCQLRNHCWESGETEGAEVCRTEYWRGESSQEGEVWRFVEGSPKYSAECILVYVRDWSRLRQRIGSNSVYLALSNGE